MFSPSSITVLFSVSISPSTANGEHVRFLKRKLDIDRERTCKAGELISFFGGGGGGGGLQFEALQQFAAGTSQDAKVTAAVNHLRTQLAPFVENLDAKFSIRNVHTKTDLWDFRLNNLTVRGTTDIIITPKDAVHGSEGVAPEILAFFEFKDRPMGEVTEHDLRQMKVELMAACVSSRRPLICFLMDLASGALAVHIEASAEDTFGIVETSLTLDELGLVLQALLRPEYETVKYCHTADQVAMPGPVRNATRFKRKFEETYLTSDAMDKLEDLLEDQTLPKHLHLQAVREYLASAGLHSNLLDIQEAFLHHREGNHQDEGTI